MSSTPGTAGADQLAMPLLVLNMGGEMLYILEQRLRAQSIPEEKSLRVLKDVISTMFGEKFITELFKPQYMYSNSSTRQIFDRLAHSSIMRLNESSMDKLYDLMTMGFKYQVLSCTHPNELLQISLNHLDALRALVRAAPETVKLVDHAQKILVEQYKDLNTGELMSLRRALARFFQDRKVKVSLFLQDGIQIVISAEGSLPPGAETPGTVRYFDDDGKQVAEEKLKLRNAENVLPPGENFDINKPTRPSKLGFNLYAKERKKGAANAKTPVKGMLGNAAGGGKAGYKLAGGRDERKDKFEPNEVAKEAAKKELNLLANLIGGPAAPGGPADKINIISLFPEAALVPDGGAGGTRSVDVITFDDSDAKSLKERLAAEFAELDIKGGAAAKGGGDDLLDLMDGAQ